MNFGCKRRLGLQQLLNPPADSGGNYLLLVSTASHVGHTTDKSPAQLVLQACRVAHHPVDTPVVPPTITPSTPLATCRSSNLSYARKSNLPFARYLCRAVPGKGQHDVMNACVRSCWRVLYGMHCLNQAHTRSSSLGLRWQRRRHPGSWAWQQQLPRWLGSQCTVRCSRVP